ncbi:MAG: tRNA lysidine(34) synthetase TilS, partial [Clostridia bacterium]|nr:tRNA lysidine(34) synthetase TilS [Clostridia bacterium]
MNTNTLIINKKAKKAIEKYGMLKNGSKIIVGLSGGADSVCLLHFLHSVKDEYNLTICAAHVNHGIRGEEAVSDSEFAREMANSLNIEFKLSEVDCIEEAELHNETVEEAGRRLRYEFFDSLRTQESDVIATAHNCNDNAETVIFNVSRGSALNGAKGIPPKRDDRIIRPLIFCTRAEIEGYCEENNLSYVTDSTNLSDDYTRNRIRHIIIPELEKINPQAVTAFSRFTEGVRSDCDYLDSVALEAYTK